MLRIIPFLILTIFMVGACSNPRKSLGLSKNAPDEFKVTKNAPLEIPPSMTLPTPRPGAPRPQEIEVTKQAKAALFGGRSAPARPSQAEALLLEQAGTANAASNIRTTIDSEVGVIDESNQSVAKRLLGIGKDGSEAKVLNATEEAERLKQTSNKE